MDGEQKAAKLYAARIKEDDLMDFQCQACGNCCHNRDQEDRWIVLTAYDIFRIAKYLDTSTKFVAENYCVPFENSETQIIHLRLKAKIHLGACAFLKSGRCSIHEAKPNVCAVYPLGRATNLLTKEVFYFRNPHSCGKTDTPYPAREWFDRFHLQESQEPFLAYSECLATIYTALRKARKKPDEIVHIYHELVYRLLYLEYDTGKDFIEQIRRNTQTRNDVVRELLTVSESHLKRKTNYDCSNLPDIIRYLSKSGYTKKEAEYVYSPLEYRKYLIKNFDAGNTDIRSIPIPQYLKPYVDWFTQEHPDVTLHV